MNYTLERTDYVNMKSPAEVTKFANELKAYVVNQNLYTPIQNKNYVNVEGWQYAGASMGILPVVESCENVSTGDEIKYQAKVILVNLTNDKTIGSGFATCSSKEAKRKTADEYVIASMAQTRAVGKAYRLTIGWIMKLAGYEATPTEEMDGAEVSGEKVDTDDIDQRLEAIRVADSPQEITQVLNSASPQERRALTPVAQHRLEELKHASSGN